jgi:hypothetical protein
MNNEEYELLGEPRMTMAQFHLEEEREREYGFDDSPWDVEPSTNMHLADTPRSDHWRWVTINRHDNGPATVYIAEWEFNQSRRMFCLRSHSYFANEWSLDRLMTTLRLGSQHDRPKNIDWLEIDFYETHVSAALKIEGRLI